MVIIFDGEQYQPSVLGFYRQTQSKKQSKTQQQQQQRPFNGL